MGNLLPFVVSGITAGAIYGLAGTGLVLTYKTSGIFNFAHGAIAALAAYLFYWLYVTREFHWAVAILVSVLLLGPAMGLCFERFARHLARQPVALRIVGTVGVILLVQGLATIGFGPQSLRLPQYLPSGTKTFEFAGVNVSYAQVTIIVVALAAVVALYVLFRFTRLGVAMRAVVDSPELVSLHGTSPQAVRRFAWVIGATFAALSGVLVAPLLGIESITLTYLIVQAFGAAAIGGFSNIPLTCLGGVLIGIAADLSKKYVLEIDWMSGLPSSLPFIVLLAALIALPARKLTQAGVDERPAASPFRAPPLLRLASASVVLAVLAIIPIIAGQRLPFFTTGLTQAIIILSLGLLVRTAGIVSLCHAAFAGIGAVAFAQLYENFDMPWLAAVVVGAFFVVPVAVLVSLPAIRLSGVFLALATFGFGVMLERLLFSRTFMFTPLSEGRRMPRPDGFETDYRYYYVVLAFLLVTAMVMVGIHQARLGRLFRGLADSPQSLAVMGLSISRTRLIAFAISGYFAGIAGILYGSSIHFAVFGEAAFSSFNSLVLLAILALAPFREPWYAVVAGVAAVIPAYWHGDDTGPWLNVLFGVFAVVVAVQGGPPTMPQRMRTFLERFEWWTGPRVVERRRLATDAIASPTPRRSSRESGLRLDRVEVRFGGNVAVKDVSLNAPVGRLTGLIGPNGAGKTTTFNAASGLLAPTTGQVLLHQQDITNLGVSARGVRGLGRTFQVMQLCDSLTVEENISLGCEAGMAGSSLNRHVVARPSERRLTHARAQASMDLCGIGHLADQQAGSLSTGQRRLVELARCLAGPFDVLLLDEPSSGLDVRETERFGEILLQVVRDRNCGILLVEHDMSLVMKICEYVYVLDFGQLLFEGTPNDVVSSPTVRDAYLGEATATEDIAAAVLP